MRFIRLRRLNAPAPLLVAVVLGAVLALVLMEAYKFNRSTYLLRGEWLFAGGPEAVTITTGFDVHEHVGGVIAANLNGDGRRDLVITTPGHIAAFDQSGDKLWVRQDDIYLSGYPGSDNLPGLHSPGVQVTDLEGDGAPELLYLNQSGAMVVLDAANGHQRSETALPLAPPDADGWQNLVVASFRAPDSVDLLLQAIGPNGDHRRGYYIAAFAIKELIKHGTQAQPLWRRNDFLYLAHGGARIADLDGDGRHEVLGGDVISPDGVRLVRVPVEGHLDALFVGDVRPDLPGLEVVSLEENGPQFVSLYNAEGVIWQVAYKGRVDHAQEPQNTAVGEFDTDRPGLEIWCRSRLDIDQKPWVLDSRGEVISHYEMADVAPRGWTRAGVEEIFSIHWTGDGVQLAAAKERHQSNDIGLFEPLSGRFTLRIDDKAARLYVADVRGDWREELVTLGSDGAVRIYENPAPNPDPDRARLWEDDVYVRSRMTWNYYSP